MNIKRQALETLKNYLAPRLAGVHVHAYSAGPEEPAQAPCLVIIGDRFVFQPFQADEVHDPGEGADYVILDVGSFAGRVEMRLYAKSVPERERLEQAILDAFLETPGAPGVVKTNSPALTVGGQVTLYQAPIAYRLDEEEWREEFAFEGRRFSFLDIEVDFPALVKRAAYTLQDVYLAITEDLTSDSPAEMVLVNDDGTTTPA